MQSGGDVVVVVVVVVVGNIAALLIVCGSAAPTFLCDVIRLNFQQLLVRVFFQHHSHQNPVFAHLFDQNLFRLF